MSLLGDRLFGLAPSILRNSSELSVVANRGNTLSIKHECTVTSRSAQQSLTMNNRQSAPAACNVVERTTPPVAMPNRTRVSISLARSNSSRSVPEKR